MQRNRICGSDIDGTGIAIENVLRSDDVRNQHEHQFVVLTLLALSGEEVAEKRDRCQPRYSVDRLAFRLLEYPAHDVGFAFTHANLVLDLALPDDRLLDAANILVGING